MNNFDLGKVQLLHVQMCKLLKTCEELQCGIKTEN